MHIPYTDSTGEGRLYRDPYTVAEEIARLERQLRQADEETVCFAQERLEQLYEELHDSIYVASVTYTMPR